MMGRAYKEAMWVLGVLLGAPAFISLIQRLWSLPLAMQLEQFIAFYRGLTQPIFDPIHRAVQDVLAYFNVSLSIPPWVGDVHALSVVGAALFIQGLYRMGVRISPVALQELETTPYDNADPKLVHMAHFFVRRPIVVRFIVLVAAVIVGLSFFGIFFWVPILGASIGLDRLTGENRGDDPITSGMSAEFAKTFWGTALAVVVFYVSNAALQSM